MIVVKPTTSRKKVVFAKPITRMISTSKLESSSTTSNTTRRTKNSLVKVNKVLLVEEVAVAVAEEEPAELAQLLNKKKIKQPLS